MSGSRYILQNPRWPQFMLKCRYYWAVGKIEKQGWVLYYVFSGQEMQITLYRIDEIVDKQDGSKIA